MSLLPLLAQIKKFFAKSYALLSSGMQKLYALILVHIYDIFFISQKLEENWKNGNCKVRVIKLDVHRHNNSDHQDFVKDLLAMDAQLLVVGFIHGEIKLYDRKSLNLIKVCTCIFY